MAGRDESEAVPREFLAQYDAERAKKLRRRVVIFCVLVLAMASYDFAILLYDALRPGYLVEEDLPSKADLAFDVTLWVLFGGALAYLLRVRCSRRAVVRASQVLVGATGVALVLFMPFVLREAGMGEDAVPRTPEGDWEVMGGALGTVFLMHLMASMLVALSAREALVPIVPVLVAFALWALFGAVGPVGERLTMVALSPLAALPGFAWSLWRYRSFADRFKARAVQARYSEVTKELTRARRVHEALFPPAITRGPIRLAYTYEPMRDIGGDFLFVRPLSFPPSEPSGPLLVVLIDVTGHGITAALAVNRLHDELERLTAGAGAVAPWDVLAALNRFVRQALAPLGIYATGVCLRVTAGEHGGPGVLEWAGGGHPPVLVRAVDGSVRALESASPMLGVVEDDLFGSDEQRMALGAGERVVAYTDGVLEAMDEGGREFGVKGVVAVLEGAGSEGGLAEAVREAVEGFRAGEAGDDVLIVGVGVGGDG